MTTLSNSENSHILPERRNSYSNKEKNIKGLDKSEIFAVFILLTLYFIQGLPIGFFGEAISLLLAEEGASFSELGTLSFVTLPFSLKILFAPFEDVHYSRRFGKRKSYIIPLQYTLALLFFLASFKIENWVHQRDIYMLSVVGIFMCCIAACQDIAVDGWVLTLLKENNVGWGSVCQNIGQITGIILSGSILIQLNSEKFCKRFLGNLLSDGQTNILSLQSMLMIFAFFVFFSTLIIHFYAEEKNPQQDESQGLFQTIKNLKGFFQNKNLKFFVIMLLFWRIGFQIVDSTVMVFLIKKGFPKEIIISINTSLIPLNFFISFCVGKYVKIGKEMYVWQICFVIHLIDNIMQYLLVQYFNIEQIGLYTIIIGIIMAISISYNTVVFVINGVFINRISDESIGGTYITFLNSVSNLGFRYTSSAALYLNDYFDYHVLVYCSWIYVVIFFIFTYKNVQKLQFLKKDQWKLNHNGSEQNQNENTIHPSKIKDECEKVE